jgi:hypothetical protein
MRDLVIGYTVFGVTAQFSISFLHHSIVLVRTILLIVLVAVFTMVLHFRFLVSCHNFLKLLGSSLGKKLSRNLKYFRNANIKN